MTVRLDEAGLDEYTDRFSHDALRYETLGGYDVASDRGELGRYLAGLPGPEAETVEPWGQWVRAQIARGATVRRIRLLTAPPGDYLRFELEWIYPANTAAGELVRVLDLTDQARPPLVVDDEFWLLDGARAAVMTYAPDGRFLHADTAEDAEARRYSAAAEAAWNAAVPLDQWWAQHPGYRRDCSSRA